MIKRKLKKCAGCGEDKILFSKGMCQYCWAVGYKKPIQKISKKREKESREYTIKRLKFLAQPENHRCPVTGERATEIHHKAGRTGSLYLDENNWLAVSRNGHRKIEENPEWAKENGYSLNRL